MNGYPVHVPAKYDFHVEYKKLGANKKGVESERFSRWGFEWSILTRINTIQGESYIGAYLFYHGPTGDGSPARRTVLTPEVTFAVKLSHKGNGLVFSQQARTQFGGRICDWGFHRMISTKTLFEADHVTVLTLQIEMFVVFLTGKQAFAILPQPSEREVSDLAGLVNLGATCYLNSVIQSLFHLKPFREIVFSIRSGFGLVEEENADELSALDDCESAVPPNGLRNSRRLPAALQKLFFAMIESNRSVSTRPLLESFGWTTAQAFRQHDAQELLALLLERIEEYCIDDAQGNNSVSRLFRGQMEFFINCKEVEFKSVREDDFYMISLPVESGTLEEALNRYFSLELLEGNNRYMTEGFGLQVAEKGERIVKCPEVLTFYIGRFRMDLESMTMVKDNSRFVFPDTIRSGSIPTLNACPPSLELYAVLVHQGGVEGGHYFVYLKLLLGGKRRWICFNDTSVNEVSIEELQETAYGGQDGSPNAYMLMYINGDQFEETVSRPTFQEVPDGLASSLQTALKRQRQKAIQKSQARFVDTVAIVTQATLEKDPFEEPGFLLGGDRACTLKLQVPRGETLATVVKAAAQANAVSSPMLRLWKLSKTGRGILRPSEPLFDSTGQEMGSLEGSTAVSTLSNVILFAEDVAAQPHALLGADIFVIVKVYKKPHWIMRSILMKGDLTPAMIGGELGLDPTDVACFEQIGRGLFEEINAHESLEDLGLSDGDIIMLVEASYAAEVKASADDWKNSVNVTCVRARLRTSILDPSRLFEWDVSDDRLELKVNPGVSREGILKQAVQEGFPSLLASKTRVLKGSSPGVQEVVASRQHTALTLDGAPFFLLEELELEADKVQQLCEAVVLMGKNQSRTRIIASVDDDAYSVVAQQLQMEEHSFSLFVMMGLRVLASLPKDTRFDAISIEGLMDGAHVVCVEKPLLADGENEIFIVLLPCTSPRAPLHDYFIEGSMGTLCLIAGHKDMTVSEARREAQRVCQRKLGQAANVRDGQLCARREDGETLGPMYGEEVSLGLQDGCNGFHPLPGKPINLS